MNPFMSGYDFGKVEVERSSLALRRTFDVFILSVFVTTLAAAAKVALADRTSSSWWLVFLPMWVGHVVACGAHLSAVLALRPLFAKPPRSTPLRAIARARVALRKRLPFLKRVIFLSLWLFVGVALVVSFEVLLCDRLAVGAKGGPPLTAVFFPLWASCALGLLHSALITTQGRTAVMCWVAVVLGLLLVRCKVDASGGDTLSWELTLLPLWVSEAAAGLNVLVVASRHLRGRYRLTNGQLGALLAYFCGLVLAVVGQALLLFLFRAPSEERRRSLLALALGTFSLAEGCFFFGIRRAVHEWAVWATVDIGETVPLTLCRDDAGHWTAVRTSGDEWWPLLGRMRYDYAGTGFRGGNKTAAYEAVDDEIEDSDSGGEVEIELT